MRSSLRPWLALPAALVALSGCQLITSLDENQITGSSGTTMSTGGAGGTGGGTSSSNSASSSSQGGAGGAACMDPVTDCPPSSTLCITPICDGTQCSTEDAAKDTACTDAGGKFCDGAGACVECNDGLTQCPDPMNECLLPSCMAGACMTTPVADLTPTSAGTQIPGDCKQLVCDGLGGTKPVDFDDPLDDGKTCTIDACVMGVNTPTPAMSGLACTDDGGKLCGSGTKAGTCVECLADGDCTGGLVCDEANDSFKCVLATCTDLTKDGQETDVDCGGPACSDCVNGDDCLAGTDCQSAFCDNGTCAACTVDANCLTGEYCDTTGPSGVCTPDQADGETCGGASQCTSGNCVDSVCCDTSCNTGCQACSAAVKGQGLDGTCGPVANTTDPDNDCATAATSTCGTTGVCNGSGACTLYPNTTVCNAQACANAVQSNADLCDGTGTCTDAGTTSCAPYQCDAAGVGCRTSCAIDGDCTTGNFCNASNQCVPTQTNGATCGGATQCSSGNCVDGVCCDTTCATGCQACSAVKKGQGVNGVCGPVVGMTDPDNDCSAAATSTCGTNGACDGLGACALYAAGTVCTAQTCSNAVVSNQDTCSGSGTCNDAGTTSCGAYQCNAGGTACLATCANDGECTTGNYCNASNQCVPAQTNGNTCSGTLQCASGNCIDGFCCNSACGAACSSCNVAGSEGTCSPVATGQTDGTCTGVSACNGSGTCLSNDGQTCSGDASCLNGHCVDGVCCDSACGGTCQACSASKKGAGANGTCGNIVTATDPDGECAGAFSCNGSGVCQSCSDGAKNGAETDLDCGGPCSGCAIGDDCNINGDCTSGLCSGGVCLGAGCSNSVKDGTETDIDCGGTCGPCVPGDDCLVSGDCSTNVCTGNICQAASCFDLTQNGAETDTDCGGGTCLDCPAGDSCNSGADCQTGVCTGNVCQLPTCTDGVPNGAETGLDCGGPDCGDCAAGQGCIGGGDCQSGVCTGNVCQAPSCTDGVLNGTETALDCGGGCIGCTNGQGCVVGADCLSTSCNAGTCQAIVCGDGFVAGIEGCDDGNSIGNDGCSTKCAVEVPYTCVGALSVCTSAKEINCNDGKDNDADGPVDCADPDCALACSASFGGACGAGEALLNYTSTDVPKTIVDNVPAGSNSIVTVGGMGAVKRVVTQFSISHAWDSDVSVKLTSPAGTATDATSGNGGSGDNYTNTILNPTCATAITAGSPPFTGCFRPEQSYLTAYVNQKEFGTWTLNAADIASGIAGTLTDWKLGLCVLPNSCGDVAVDAGEACDDGNNTNADGCDNNCTVTACGNGIITAGEVCDDGNLVSGDGCDSNCKVTACGNGIITAGEVCDDDNVVSGDGCDANCTPTGCGNGVITSGEGCEDGNATPGDGCTSCVVDAGFGCFSLPSMCFLVCGNGTTSSPETCDDNNTANGDGCDAACATETDIAEIEMNGTIAAADTQAGAGVLISGASTVISGAITPALERDFFKMSLASASVVHFETFDASGSDCTSANVSAAMRLSVVNGTACTVATQATDCAAVGALCNATSLTCQIKVDSSTKGIGFCSALTLNMAAGDYYAFVERPSGGTIAAYKLQVKIDTDKGAEVEPNNTQPTANSLTGSDVYVFGGHQVANNNDVFAIQVPAGKSVRAEIIEGNAETCESNGVDSRLRLLSPTFADLGNIDDNGRGFCSLMDGTGASPTHPYAHNLTGGTYYIRVEESDPVTPTVDDLFDYRLVVTVR